jgi:hypothetical protein
MAVASGRRAGRRRRRPLGRPAGRLTDVCRLILQLPSTTMHPGSALMRGDQGGRTSQRARDPNDRRPDHGTVK